MSSTEITVALVVGLARWLWTEVGSWRLRRALQRFRARVPELETVLQEGLAKLEEAERKLLERASRSRKTNAKPEP